MTPRRHAYLGVFDAPPWKDWTVWTGFLLGVLFVGAIPADESYGETSTTPVWADVPLIFLLVAFLFGFLPALIRRISRAVMPMLRRGPSRETRHHVAPRAVSTPPPAQPDSVSSGSRPTAHPASPTGAEPGDSGTQPVSLSAYDGSTPTSAVLNEARDLLPYPVARAARALHLSADSRDQYEGILDASEALTICLGITGASWLHRYEPSAGSLQLLNGAFVQRGVSQGHWHEVARDAERAMAQSPQALPGFSDGVRPGPKSTGLLADLKVLLEERNRAAHGARPHNRAEAAARVADFLPPLERALERARFLAATPVVLAEASAYRRRDRQFDVRLHRAMGDHPEFEATSVVLTQPLANDTFYLLAEPQPLDLTPFLVMRYCELCRQREVCYADRIDAKHGVSLKSVGRGHQIWDRTLLEDFASLGATAS